MNTSACILLEYCFHVCRYIPRERISGSYGSSRLVFLGTSILFSHSDAIYIPNKCSHISLSLYPHYLLFVEFLMIAIWTGVMCYLTVCLDLHSLIICNVEHIFMCLLPIYMSSLKKKCLFCPLILLSHFLILTCMSCLFILYINPLLVTSFAKNFPSF